MKQEENHYSRLGIPFDATPEEIQHAYRVAARRLHPDTNVEDGATELFLKVQESYEILSNPDRRLEYDASLPSDFNATPPVAINTQFSRTTLQKSNEPQLIYALIDLIAQPEADMNPSPPLNVCLVLDCSTSMQGANMDTVKSTAIELVRQLRTQDILSLVTFSDRSEVLIPAGSRYEPHKAEIIIRMLQTAGGTEIFKGLESGFNEVYRLLRRDYVNHIILLTDGRTYGDEADCLHIAEQAANYGIGISALGIGGKWNDAFLDSLTSATGGSSIYVSKSDEIRQYLKDKFSGLGKSYADRVTYTFELGIGVELRSAFRLQPDSAQLQIVSPIRMGSIPKSAGLGVLLEFFVGSVPNNLNQIKLAEGLLTLDIPARSNPSFSTRLKLYRPTSAEADFSSPPIEIIQAMSRITLYRMQEKVQEDLATGHISEATERLQNLATHLIAQGERELANAVLEEANHLQQYQKGSEQGKKRIKYGTRDLLLAASQHSSGLRDVAGIYSFTKDEGKGAGS
jgi:Ca-activated chloride channel family protein